MIWEYEIDRSWIVCNVTGAVMKKIETAFILAVTTMVMMVFILSLNRCSKLQGLWHESSTAASIGKPRTVDVEQIRLLMNQGKLSDQEANFYTTAPVLEELPPAFSSRQK